MARPSTPQNSKSFTRLEPARLSPLVRSRASTLQNEIISENLPPEMMASPYGEDRKHPSSDIFEKSSLISGEEGSIKDVNELDSPHDVPEDFDDLPIELISLIDR